MRLGLDLPLWQQYWEFVKGFFVGRTYGSGTATFTCPAPAWATRSARASASRS